MCGECSLCIINKFRCPATVVGDLFKALAICEREEGLGVLEGLVCFVRPDEGMLVFSQVEQHRRVLFSWQEKALWSKFVGKRFSQGFAGKSGCEALRLNLSGTIQVRSWSFFYLPDRFACFSAGCSRSLSSSSSFSWSHESCISSLWSMSVCRGFFFPFFAGSCMLLSTLCRWCSSLGLAEFTVWSVVSLDLRKDSGSCFTLRSWLSVHWKECSFMSSWSCCSVDGWHSRPVFLGSWRSLVTRVEL